MLKLKKTKKNKKMKYKEVKIGKKDKERLVMGQQ